MEIAGQYLLLIGAGFAAGVLNVMAGGGSFLTLPLLIFLGLSPTVANGTNRIAVLLQSLGAAHEYQRLGTMEWSLTAGTIVPSTAGSLMGTWAALVIGDQAFKKVLSLLMVAVTLWMLWKPLQDSRDAPRDGVPGPTARALLFFLVGIYGGFVQAGVGFLILAVTTLMGLDLLKGNAIKVLIVCIFTAVSVALFAWNGKIDWPIGLVLAAGTVLGGLAGVRLSLRIGHIWIRRIVMATVLIFAAKLWLES